MPALASGSVHGDVLIKHEGNLSVPCKLAYTEDPSCTMAKWQHQTGQEAPIWSLERYCSSNAHHRHSWDSNRKLHVRVQFTACSLTASCFAFCLSFFFVSRTSCSRLVTPGLDLSLHDMRPGQRAVRCRVRTVHGNAHYAAVRICQLTLGRGTAPSWTTKQTHMSAAPLNSSRSRVKSIMTGIEFENSCWDALLQIKFWTLTGGNDWQTITCALTLPLSLYPREQTQVWEWSRGLQRPGS